ncbi:hypothetical protein [Alysiella filiformis]|uniref:Uncharacterized protein n=1 Tax=Alysiella filiformis DSM 16848 TaxID=1120981 RepID=A0A286E5P0_9NEIS|nr:hypothetical protein [Alysiella filiformis]QMT30368.1 hypothetical protein H3L97_06260 [Alysiella filiformis]UBQ56653.1 hypothetical protein JF568_02430 [Alysiella filiformis DSM 16848]SOD66181.1 hypothetical protein SAMN02746062_00528 [Alysiella filiformis DSM 16848]
MFTINNQNLDMSHIYYQEKKYGINTQQKEVYSFLWSENIDLFLSICQKNIDDFILDCTFDSYDDLNGLEIEYLYNLNFPNSSSLLRNNPNEFCDLLYKYQNLLIFTPIFHNNTYNWQDSNIFIINPIQSISIENNHIKIQGIGYFLNK